MKTDNLQHRSMTARQAQRGFTLIEVVVAMAVAALVFAGLFQGYNMVGQQAQFSACSLAAGTTAMQQIEQVLAANWVPSYGQTQLFNATLSLPQTGNLCLPISLSNNVNCTNYTTVTQVSSNPPYAMIQVQCVWTFPSYGGVFTNTVAVLRAPNL